ncbi:MAG: hypothetical protein JSW06_07850 [Thermoplasmatales archaeon]|nr:MAG: hypothetical protein JSW06_07850 [Thermoplasmatales archaeon]
MFPLQKNKKINQAGQIDDLLLPFTGMVFSKKPITKEKPEESSIDFHLEIIKKIDKLLKKHEGESFSLDSNTGQQTSDSPEEHPIEIRDPLSKKIGLSEVKPGIKPDDIFTNRGKKPGDFKTDISTANDLGFIEDILLMKEKENKHIEIINLDSLSVGDATTQKISTLSQDETRGVNHQIGNSLKNRLYPDKIISKKVEIIDAKELENKKYDNIFSKPIQQPKENERKAQVYYIDGSRHQKENRFKESDRVHAPENFRDKLKELEEAEEELKRKKKELEEQEKDAEKLKKLEAKKTILEAKEKEKAAKKAKKENEAKLKRQEKEQREKEKEEKKLKRFELKKAAEEKKKKEIEARKAEKEKEKELLKKAAEEKKKKEIEARKAEKEKEKELLKKAVEEEKLKKLELKKAMMEAKEEEREKEKISIQEQKEEKQLYSVKEERQRGPKKKLVWGIKKEREPDEKKDIETEPTLLDEDIKKLLVITDNLLGELPEEVIDKFAQSKDFKLYLKVLNKYKIK